MPDAILRAPMHSEKPAGCLAYIGNDDHHKARGADHLKIGCLIFSSRELKCRAGKQHKNWDERCNGPGKCGIHAFVLVSMDADGCNGMVTFFSGTVASLPTHRLSTFPDDERHDDQSRNGIGP